MLRKVLAGDLTVNGRSLTAADLGLALVPLVTRNIGAPNGSWQPWM